MRLEHILGQVQVDDATLAHCAVEGVYPIAYGPTGSQSGFTGRSRWGKANSQYMTLQILATKLELLAPLDAQQRP